ncbi:hypothetical protein [uncultured Rikenella sp.]|uniref:hypothetical protein n=1 Tax=uncultured Rikenella sp. TaxID=368003 RepID=UPI00263A12B4|nr:hypothetical protein [uncultured Rikenella sp.]
MPKRSTGSTVRIENSKVVHTVLDSLLLNESTARLELRTTIDSETETELIVYDSQQPPNDSTGLPPVRAVWRQSRKEARQERQNTESSDRTDLRISVAETETLAEQAESVHKEERKPTAGTGTLKFGIGLVLSAVAACGIGLLFRRLKRR